MYAVSPWKEVKIGEGAADISVPGVCCCQFGVEARDQAILFTLYVFGRAGQNNNIYASSIQKRLRYPFILIPANDYSNLQTLCSIVLLDDIVAVVHLSHFPRAQESMMDALQNIDWIEDGKQSSHGPRLL